MHSYYKLAKKTHTTDWHVFTNLISSKNEILPITLII